MEKQSSADQRDDHTTGAEREQKFTAFAVHQNDGANRSNKINNGKKEVTQMGLLVTKTRLNQYGRVVADDGIDAGGLIAGEDDAGQHKWNHVFAAEQGFLDARAGGFGFFGGNGLLHFLKF